MTKDKKTLPNQPKPPRTTEIDPSTPEGMEGAISFFTEYSQYKTEEKEFLSELAESLYQFRENPLWAWVLIDLCVERGEDFPDWVRSYLKKCAAKLLRIVDNPPGKKATDTATARAIGLHYTDGQGTKFSRFKNESFQRFIVDIVETEWKKLKDKGTPKTKEQVIGDVLSKINIDSEKLPSIKTVMNWIYGKPA